MQYKPEHALIEASLNGAPMKPHHKRDMLSHGMLIGTADLKIFCDSCTIHIEFKKPEKKVLNKITGNLNKKAGGVKSKEQKELFEQLNKFSAHHYYFCDNIPDFIKICKKHIHVLTA